MAETTGGVVIDVTAATFQEEVVERSRNTPVLLDFWADWCGPCKTLGPVLEQLAADYGGGFVLGKVDSERETELAQAFQVQSIPFCVLIDNGKPVDAFQGALPESEVRRFLQRNTVGRVAEQAEAPGEEAEPVDPDSPAARLERAIESSRRGDATSARAELVGFPEEDEEHARAERLLTALSFLEADLEVAKGGAEGALAAGRAQLVSGQPEAAMDRILEAVAADKTFRDGLPRQAMLLCFLLVGEDDERLDPFRRRLATLLY